MSLKSKFKTNAALAQNGVWVEFPQDKNKDGSIPGFCLARMSKQNKKYIVAARHYANLFERDSDGKPIMDSVPSEEQDGEFLAMFVDTVLLRWRNFQPEDDGVELPFSREAALSIFGNDEWEDLYGELLAKAQKASTFRRFDKARETEAKN